MAIIQKPVRGYERYVVNSKGEVFSIQTGKKLKPWSSNGYEMVSLAPGKPGTLHNGPRNIRVHRIVAEAFIPNPKKLPFVNHKNGNKVDNTLKNLEWIDPKGNAQHYQKVLRPKKETASNIATMQKYEDEKASEIFTNQKIISVMNLVTANYGRDNPEIIGKVYMTLIGASGQM